MIAMVMQGAGKPDQASELIQSIKEYVVGTEEMGIYFDTRKAQYSWMSYKIPTQVAAMEAINRIAPDTEMLNGMKQWLLKQKQVQVWETPIATADAVYAFLSMGGNKLNQSGSMEASVGGSAVYAQYLEDMDKVSSAKGAGLQIERTFFRDGKELDSKTVLHVGDKVTVCLTISADRDMDFIQVKDERAACMEPEQQLSGYHWSGGIGYYLVSRDASTSFFIDQLRKGTYQLEYTVYIDRAGTYQASGRCRYYPVGVCA